MNLIEFLRLPLEDKVKGVWFSGVKGEGEYIEYWDNGQIYEHSYYKRGVPHGKCKWWDMDGILGGYFLYENGIEIKDYLK